jgi:hypothetical protein
VTGKLGAFFPGCPPPSVGWLDETVFAAYGWKSDLSDEEILEKLLSRI